MTKRPNKFESGCKAFATAVRLALSLLMFAETSALIAQTQQTSQQASEAALPSFEVASIKLLPPDAGKGATGVGVSAEDPSMISMKSVSLLGLLMRAYGLKALQVSGPDWLSSQFYDVSAKLPAGSTVDQIPVMLQQLITERFHPTLSWDTKTETGYALVIEKSGSKLVASADQENHATDRPDVARSISMSDTVKMQGAPIAALATVLWTVLGKPVEDSTGLKGRFDITLNVSFKELTAIRNGPSPSSDDGGSTPGVLFEALRDLGLRLELQKIEVKQLVVVQADRNPTEN